MRIQTWLDRLADDSNSWLLAIKAEDRGEILKAIELYIDDAKKSLKDDFRVRAALSVSCAADCIGRIGSQRIAQKLNTVAAYLYWDNADSIMGQSIREALWSLQQSHESFLLAGELDNACVVQRLFLSMAGRANPFIGGEDAFKLAEFIHANSQNGATLDSDITLNIEKLVEPFLQMWEKRSNKMKIKNRAFVPDPESEFLEAQSFVSQLG